MIVKNDTVFKENISLVSQQDELLYIPAVSGQNNNQPVVFRCVSNNAGAMVFENKEHDFPQRIIYLNKRPDSLYARIEGTEKGKFRKEEFFMARHKKGH